MEPSERSPLIQFLHKVRRSGSDKKLGGVCGGLAVHSDIPAWVYRALFIILLVIGVGAIAYIALWICMPAEEILEGTEPEGAQSAESNMGN